MLNWGFQSKNIYENYGKDKQVLPDFRPNNSENLIFNMRYFDDIKKLINKFDKKYRFKAEWIGHINEYNEKNGLLSGAFSNTPSQYKNENDYIIYLVKSRCDKSGYCNHGDFLLAAFNKKTNEVIFKSEEW